MKNGKKRLQISENIVVFFSDKELVDLREKINKLLYEERNIKSNYVQDEIIKKGKHINKEQRREYRKQESENKQSNRKLLSSASFWTFCDTGTSVFSNDEALPPSVQAEPIAVGGIVEETLAKRRKFKNKIW